MFKLIHFVNVFSLMVIFENQIERVNNKGRNIKKTVILLKSPSMDPVGRSWRILVLCDPEVMGVIPIYFFCQILDFLFRLIRLFEPSEKWWTVFNYHGVVNLQCLFLTSLYWLEKTQCIPNFARLENCEFCQTFASLKTLVLIEWLIESFIVTLLSS